MIADSHIHLAHFLYENSFPYLDYRGGEFTLEANGTRAGVIEAMRRRGIAFCIEPGIELESNERLLALSRQLPGFHYPAVGVHPTRTHDYMTVDREDQRQTRRLRPSDFRRLERLAESAGIVAIGETGLDYHLPRGEQHRLAQAYWFVRQLSLAHRLRLPLILHIREADRDALCRQFLVDIGLQEARDNIETYFMNVHYFPVSAIGHDQNGEEYEPWGVMEPLEWLLTLADPDFSEAIGMTSYEI